MATCSKVWDIKIAFWLITAVAFFHNCSPNEEQIMGEYYIYQKNYYSDYEKIYGIKIDKRAKILFLSNHTFEASYIPSYLISGYNEEKTQLSFSGTFDQLKLGDELNDGFFGTVALKITKITPILKSWWHSRTVGFKMKNDTIYSTIFIGDEDNAHDIVFVKKK